MEELIVHTKKEREIIDITKELEHVIREKKVKDGVSHVFVTHTSAAITTSDLDQGTDLDMLDAFDAMGLMRASAASKLKFRHPHNPAHVKDHIVAAMIGPSPCLPIEEGELVLGPWQRVVLVELGGPRERTIVVNFS